ncbi:hypothetical protein PU02_0962 [Bartonella ancashensis]|uniref:Uncharacterized protein n=1 Tax=Bartonella ancashensis TaxID=1318743 RepID=A0A0M4L8H6_9HYPH|nr:hypothetical protein PU02_0962 [Bartonella ancashensis]
MTQKTIGLSLCRVQEGITKPPIVQCVKNIAIITKDHKNW